MLTIYISVSEISWFALTSVLDKPRRKSLIETVEKIEVLGVSVPVGVAASINMTMRARACNNNTHKVSFFWL